MHTLPWRAAVLLIDRRRGKPRHLVNSDAIKALLDAYDVPYTHLVDFRGTFEQQVRRYPVWWSCACVCV